MQGWLADLAASHGKLGQIYLRMGRRAEASDMFQNGRALIVAMAGRSGHSRWAGLFGKL